MKSNPRVYVEQVMALRTEVFQIPLFLLQDLFGDVCAAMLVESGYPNNLLSALLSIIRTVELHHKVGDRFQSQFWRAASGAHWATRSIHCVVHGGAAPEADGRFAWPAASVHERIDLEAYRAFELFESLQVLQERLHENRGFAHLLISIKINVTHLINTCQYIRVPQVISFAAKVYLYFSIFCDWIRWITNINMKPKIIHFLRVQVFDNENLANYILNQDLF